MASPITSHNFSGTSLNHAYPHAGFSVIELMVAVAIVAVLAALAGPSFASLIDRWRVRDAVENLTATLYFARSEAIKRGGNVIIAKNADSATCTTTQNTQWSCGWQVFVDVNGNGSQDTCTTDVLNECTVKQGVEPKGVTVNLANSTGAITVDRWGMTSHTPSSGGSGTPSNMFFEAMPKNKSMSDASAARLCAGSGGRLVHKTGAETC
jgi:type IV fimbrial biogenesis protein FimT